METGWECQASFPSPAGAGAWTLQGGCWVCWETSTIHPPRSAHGWKPCWGLAVLSLLPSQTSLPSPKSAAREISRQNWKCRGHLGWVGTRVGWDVGVNSPLCLLQAPVLARPKGFAPGCASALHLSNSSNSFPHPYIHPKTAWPGCRAGKLGNIPLLYSAESR